VVKEDGNGKLGWRVTMAAIELLQFWYSEVLGFLLFEGIDKV